MQPLCEVCGAQVTICCSATEDALRACCEPVRPFWIAHALSMAAAEAKAQHEPLYVSGRVGVGGGGGAARSVIGCVDMLS